jgi:hypothetical protein
MMWLKAAGLSDAFDPLRDVENIELMLGKSWPDTPRVA